MLLAFYSLADMFFYQAQNWVEDELEKSYVLFSKNSRIPRNDESLNVFDIWRKKCCFFFELKKSKKFQLFF